LIFDSDRSLSRERARSCQVALLRAEEFCRTLNAEIDLVNNRLTAFPLGLNQKTAENRALELDLAYENLTLEFEASTPVTTNLRPTLDLELSRLQFFADLLKDSVSEGPRRVIAPKFADYYHRIREQYDLDFGEGAEHALNQIASPTGSLVPQHVWVKFVDQLRSALRQQSDVGYQWRLTKHHVEVFSQVLQASSLMYDCLQVAAVADRSSIMQSLLSPTNHRDV
jgi:hypothetical protein